MSKIIGVTVGTNISPAKVKEEIKPVISVNGVKPDADGNVKIAITNGKDGVDGKDGYTPVKGVDYFDGKDGKDGYTPVKGVDYFDGKDGTNGKDGYTPVKGVDYFDGNPGKDGSPGKDGEDGYTPVKGKDYFTEAEISEMVQSVITALPKYNGEVVSV